MIPNFKDDFEHISKEFAMNKREKTIHIKATLFGLSGLKISLHVI